MQKTAELRAVFLYFCFLDVNKFSALSNRAYSSKCRRWAEALTFQGMDFYNDLNIVQIGELRVNTTVTSKKSILKTCRKLVSEKGLSALHMRSVAQGCGVALGALYYYFPSKNDLLIATIESVWEDIFHIQDIPDEEITFLEYIGEIFRHMQEGIKKYPHFFTIHSISVSVKNQGEAHDTMRQYLTGLKKRMTASIRADKHIRQDAFSKQFSEMDFVDFVLSNLICLLVQKKQSCTLLLEVINRTLY